MPEVALETSRIKEIEAQIGGLWNGCEDAIEEVRQRANIAVQIAWKLGTLLIEAKKELGHGNFGLWQIKFGIPVSTASNYMQLAKKYPTIEDLPENKRQAYLSIGILPNKDEVVHEGNVTLPKSPLNHLQFYNKWSEWFGEVKAQKIKFAVTDEVKNELKPMYEWMKGIYGEN